LSNADLSSAKLAGADLTGADLGDADLRYADLGNVRCDSVASARLANIYGVRNISLAMKKKLTAAGAIAVQADEEWIRLESKVSR
jgi:uncharacterized protein YjbI with pentapeptide repeats